MRGLGALAKLSLAGGWAALACGDTPKADALDTAPVTQDATPAVPNEAQKPGSDGECAQVGRLEQPLSVVDRWLIGTPAQYPPDPALRPELSALAASQRLRRERAWQIAERVLTPVALAGELSPLVAAELPAFQTWHGRDDITRIFRRLYAELGEADRKRRARFSPGALEAAWRWNDDAVADFEAWTAERRATYSEGIDDASSAHGLGGLTRVTYSPAASQHLLLSYPEVVACREGRAHAPADDAAASASSEGCGSQLRDPACLADAFPPGAAIIKASFRRADVTEPLDVYVTSSDALRTRMSSNEPSWERGDEQASPSESDAYTLELPNGNVYWLTGLHVMTKELDDWFWLSLWWSADPDSDFGADRPGSIPAPFNHYKLCSVVDFVEGDVDPTGGFDGDQRSLGDALAVMHEGPTGPTWCSNPYIEIEPGAAETSCIGCHQHAASGLSSTEIISDERARPARSRARTLDRIDSDYVFGLSTGEDLGSMFLETEQHFAP